MSALQISISNLKTLNMADDLGNLQVASDGKLSVKKVERGFYASWNSMTSFFTGSEDKNNAIKIAISNVLKDIDKYGENKILENAKISPKEVKALIIDKLLDFPDFFDPLSLYHYKNIQNLLLTELAVARSSKESLGNNYKLEVSIAKAKLMFMLRIGLIQNKGSTGSIIISWFNMPKKELAVFKPVGTNTNLSNLITYVRQSFANVQDSYLSTATKAKPSAEVAAHILDKRLGLDLTCQTVMRTFSKKDEKKKLEGSFQLFAKDMYEAEDVLKVLESKHPNFCPKEIQNFQKMAIFSFLAGDLDGHSRNWLIKPEGKCLINEIKKIDNANTFIQTNPTKKCLLSDTKQYAWVVLNIAKILFTDESKNIMRKVLVPLVDEIVAEIREHVPGFLDEKIIALLHQRASVLRALAEVKEASPKMFGDLQTDKEINDFLDSYSSEFVPKVKSFNREIIDFKDDYEREIDELLKAKK